MDKLFGRGLPPSGFLPRPSLNPFQGMTETPMGFRPLGMSKEAPFGTGFVGRSMENAINQNPFFKAQMERVLGGTIIPDARTDGRLTVYRSPFNQIGSLMQNAFAGGLPQQGLAGILGGLNLPFGPSFMGSDLSRSVLGGLQRMEGNIASFMQGLPQSPFEGTMLNQLQNFPFPGSILGGPIGGLIGELQNNNSYNPLLDNLGQSFQIMGNMMQAAAYGDMRFLTNFRA
jgi:hypothetical protein